VALVEQLEEERKEFGPDYEGLIIGGSLASDDVTESGGTAG
jgi:hypothetical protein